MFWNFWDFEVMLLNVGIYFSRMLFSPYDCWNLVLSNLYIVISVDGYRSQIIQKKLEKAIAEKKNMGFHKKFPQALTLITDVFDNYVIQKIPTFLSFISWYLQLSTFIRTNNPFNFLDSIILFVGTNFISFQSFEHGMQPREEN